MNPRRFVMAVAALSVSLVAGAAEPVRILLIAGKPSHPHGEHEFRAGALLLQRCLNTLPGVQADVASNGWPVLATAFEGVAAVAIYADGGDGHPAVSSDHMKVIDGLARRGVGLGFMHYGVEVPKGDAGVAMQRWIGGYYENAFSCNPMWSPDFKSLPKHPVTRGVHPFSIPDEWYFNMRFRDDLQGVTPILTATPSDKVRDGPYVWPKGPYPHIRQAKGREESMMWVREREEGGRGFGFTGGHFHKNWAHADFRKVVLNALLWIAKLDVPDNGVEVAVSDQDLASNLDLNK